MKTRINPAAIGIFITGALVILVVSLVLFGSGRYFRKTKDLLLTFREPVTGLELGAPVKLMGVTVGDVKQIAIEVDTNALDTLLISVVIEIDRENSRTAFQDYSIDLDDRTQFDAAIAKMGLRGRLEVLSLLSGQLYIALDMSPGEAGFQLQEDRAHGLWQVPTLPSTKRQLIQSALTSLDNLTQFDFKSTSEELKGLLKDLRADLAGMELKQAGTNLTATLAEIKHLLEAPQLRSAITNLDLALAQVHTLGENVNAQINPLLTEVKADLKKAGSAFDEAAQALRQLKAQVEPSSALSRELVRTLEEAGTALSALRQLAEQIERNPSSLITGKKESSR